MKNTTGIVCLITITSATISTAAINQNQWYSIGVANAGAVYGIGQARAMNFDMAINGQGAGPGLQMQGGGALLMGRSTGRGTTSGFIQGAQVDAAQSQKKDIVKGKTTQKEGILLNAGQMVGKTDGGRGTANGLIITGGANMQLMRNGRMVLGQGSLVANMQSANANGGPGSTVIVMTGSQAETYQKQTVTRPQF